MAFQIQQFDWLVGEEQWARSIHHWENPAISTVDGRSAASTEVRLVMTCLRGLLLFLLALLLVTGSPLSLKQDRHEQLHSTVSRLLAQEAQIWRANERDEFAQLIDESVAPMWVSEWRRYWHQRVHERAHFGEEITHVERVDDYLFAQMLVNRPAAEWWLVSPVRQTRIYRQMDGKWLRTVPTHEFWGEPITIETENIRYTFPQREAAFVEQISEHVEQTFAFLHAEFGLSSTRRNRKMTIQIAPSAQQGRLTRGYHIDVTVPLLASIPYGSTDEEYATRFITNQLVAMAINRHLDYSRVAYAYHWGMMTWAARGWLENHLMGEPSLWFLQSEETFWLYNQERGPILLNDITRIRNKGETPTAEHFYWQYVASELLIEYAIETYGQDSLRSLLRGFSQYESWDELIPQIFGLPAVEFEAGFNQFLNNRYMDPGRL